jgi:hypothetical protein
MVQKQQRGYVYDREEKTFVQSRDPNDVKRAPGSGLAMMQLNWPGDALRLDDNGRLTRIPDTVLENLEYQGVQ